MESPQYVSPERKVQLGCNSGLSIVERMRLHQTYLLITVNESPLEYTLTLCFDISSNLRFVPKSTSTEMLDALNFRITIPPFQSKKMLLAGAIDPEKPFELAYRSAIQWQAARFDPTAVPDLMAKVEDLANGVTDPQKVSEFCLRNQLHFLDLSFPPTKKSLKSSYAVNWRRPQEFLEFERASLFGPGPPEPRHLVPGSIRQPRFMSALAVLAERPELLLRSVPTQHNDLSVGILKVQLCLNGYWEFIMMDSFFPCDPATDLPLFIRAKGGELWPNALEKAYAKLLRGYELLDEVDLPNLLSDVTGHPCSQLRLRAKDLTAEMTWDTLHQWVAAGDIIVCSMPVDQTKPGDDLFPVQKGNCEEGMDEHFGLQLHHHYAVLGIREYHDVHHIQHPKLLLKLRNHPWATEDWAGCCGPSWNGWTPDARQQLGYDPCWMENTFWIPVEDACRHFTRITACHYRPLWHDFRVHGCLAKDRAADVCFEFLQRDSGSVQFILTQPSMSTTTKRNYRYLTVALFILRPSGLKYELHACSKFCAARQVFLDTVLPASERPYLVIPVSFEYGRSQNFTLAAISPTLEVENIQLKSGSRDLAERCELLACREFGTEVIIKRGRYAKILRTGRVVTVAALNSEKDLWNIHFDFRQLKGWTSHNIYNKITDIQMEVPGGQIRFIETFFNTTEWDDHDFIYTFLDSSSPSKPFVPPSYDCLEEGPIAINPSLMRIVRRPIQFEGTEYSPDVQGLYQVKDDSLAGQILQTKYPAASLHAAKVGTPTLPLISSNSFTKRNKCFSSSGSMELPVISPAASNGCRSPATTALVSTPLVSAVACDDDDDLFETVSSEEALRRQFKRFDRHNNGFLWRSEFRREYQKLDTFGSPMPKHTIDDLFSRYDKGDDRLGFDEFCLLMLQRARW